MKDMTYEQWAKLIRDSQANWLVRSFALNRAPQSWCQKLLEENRSKI